MASCIHLVLANPAAPHLIRDIKMQGGLAEGDHRPVLITLTIDSGHIDWQPPLPCPPELLLEPGPPSLSSGTLHQRRCPWAMRSRRMWTYPLGGTGTGKTAGGWASPPQHQLAMLCAVCVINRRPCTACRLSAAAHRWVLPLHPRRKPRCKFPHLLLFKWFCFS